MMPLTVSPCLVGRVDAGEPASAVSREMFTAIALDGDRRLYADMMMFQAPAAHELPPVM